MATVLVTRPSSHGDDEFHRLLNDAGIEVVDIPLITFSFPPDLAEVDSALYRMSNGEFNYVVFSSPTGVCYFEKRVKELGLLEQTRKAVCFGAVGEATAMELTRSGMTIALPVPNTGGSGNFLRLLKEVDMQGKRILLLQSQIGLDILENGLASLGAFVQRITLYLTHGPSEEDTAHIRSLIQKIPPDIIAFFSPSAVHNFLKIVGQHSKVALAAIGATTTDAIREGFSKMPEIVSSKPDLKKLAEAIIHFMNANERPIL